MPMIAKRIQERLEVLGISQAELARRAGLAQSTVNALVSGKARSSAHLHVMARVLGVSTQWLAGESDDASIGEGAEAREAAANSIDAVMVPTVDFIRSCRGELVVVEYIPLSKKLLATYQTDNGGVTAACGYYDSDNMSPTIGKGELVLVDSTEHEITQQDSVWWLCYGEFGTIRRVRKLHDGRFELLSDNPRVQPVIAAEGEFQVLGCVTCVVKPI